MGISANGVQVRRLLRRIRRKARRKCDAIAKSGDKAAHAPRSTVLPADEQRQIAPGAVRR
jgi:hypothetical protein